MSGYTAEGILAWMEAETNIADEDAKKTADMIMEMVSEIYGSIDSLDPCRPDGEDSIHRHDGPCEPADHSIYETNPDGTLTASGAINCLMDEKAELGMEAFHLREVLKALHGEYLDYSIINHLSGHNNHNVRWARRVMGMKEVLTLEEARDIIPSPLLPPMHEVQVGDNGGMK